MDDNKWRKEVKKVLKSLTHKELIEWATETIEDQSRLKRAPEKEKYTPSWDWLEELPKHIPFRLSSKDMGSVIMFVRLVEIRSYVEGIRDVLFGVRGQQDIELLRNIYLSKGELDKLNSENNG